MSETSTRSWARAATVLLFAVTLTATMFGDRPTALAAEPPDRDESGPPVIQVVGGTPVPDGTYPFVAAILIETLASSDHDRQFCTGSLVAAGWVLTAAHCVVDNGFKPEDLAVTVGRTVLSSDQGERFKVAEIVPHPSFDWSDLGEDVAMLRLAGASAVDPVRLPLPSENEYEAHGTMVTIAGWGNTEPYFDDTTPDRLQSAALPVVGDEACGFSRKSGTRWICAGGVPGIDGCFGDSGGPLFAVEPDGGFLQIGTTSYGSYPCAIGHPAGFVELNNPEVRNFIEQTVRRPLDPCLDFLQPNAGFGFGPLVRSGNELWRAHTVSGKVCPTARTDRFGTHLISVADRREYQSARATLRFDPSAGDVELRLFSCDEGGCQQPLVPTDSHSAPGVESLRWTNTTGEDRHVVVEVALAGGGRAPVPYEVELAQTDVCNAATVWQLPSVGETHYPNTLCDEHFWEVHYVDLAHGTTFEADLQLYGTGPVELWAHICDELCEDGPSAVTDAGGAASISWTNCTGGTRQLWLYAVYTGGALVNYDLDVSSAVTPGACA